MYISCQKDILGSGTLTIYVFTMVQKRTRTQVSYLPRIQEMRILVWNLCSTSGLGYIKICRSDIREEILGYHLLNSMRSITHDAPNTFIDG